MNIKTLTLFYELARDLNMTKTAKRLFISQQTLSNNILRLEEYYGVKLFHRHHGLELTDAGLYLKDFAQKAIGREKELFDALLDFKTEERGFIRFGASPNRSSYFVPEILPNYSKDFPNVEFSLTYGNTDQLLLLLRNRQIDAAVCALKEIPANIKAELLVEDQLYLCVPENLLDKHYSSTKEELKEKSLHGANLADFKDLSYFMMSNTNRLSDTISKCFEEAGYLPKVYFSAKYATLSTFLCEKGLAAAFMTKDHIILNDMENKEGINLFPVNFRGEPVYHYLYLIHLKNQFVPKYKSVFYNYIINYYHSRNITCSNHQ